jgi:protein ImuA
MKNINPLETLAAGLPLVRAGDLAARTGCTGEGLAALSASVHLLSAETDAQAATLAGFVAACLAQAPARPVVWVTHPRSRIDGGELHGPGLAELGVDPGRLLLVNAHSSGDVFWTLEEALASRAVAAAVGELPAGCRSLGLTSTRRLALRSEKAGVPVYLLTVGSALPATACRTVWRLAARPGRTAAAGRVLLGLPSWRAEMLKNKSGSCTDMTLRYRPSDRDLSPTAGEATPPLPAVEAPAARPVVRPSLEPAVVRFARTEKTPAWDR